MNNFKDLPGSARVWVYQASRFLSADEVFAIEKRLTQFVNSWTAHQQQLMASGAVFHSLFIIIAVDETVAGASGCSIDKAFHFIKQLENDFSVNLTDRLLFAVELEDKLRPVTRQEFTELLEKGDINGNTIVYDNLIETKASMELKWRIPLRDSWLASYFKISV